MNKELIDKAWACLPREFKEKVKKEYARCVKIDADDNPNLPAYAVKSAISRRALLEKIFGEHNLTSDAEGEEMLTLPRKAIIQAYKKSCAKSATKYNVGYADCLYNLFGSKCLPYETKNGAKDRAKEPKPAEPKFKEGDKVRIVDDCHGQKYRGDVTEVVYVDESDPDATYKVDIYDEECGGGLWYSESDLEPYTEPTANYMQVDYHGADTAASTIADSCQSQPVTDYFDRIVKDEFRGHNRLHIAAMAMQGILANSHQGMVDMKIDKVAELAIAAADKLIAECEKGGEA